jgi:hypothetical protein
MTGTDDRLPAEGRRDEAGRLGEGADPGVWEVFRQEKDGEPMRQESVRLWIVQRTQISDLSDPDLLQPPLDRTFKKPGGYVLRDKLDAAKKRAKK